MAIFNVGDAVQVGTAAEARHGSVAALVTEPDGAQSYDVTFVDGGEARVREGDLAPCASEAGAVSIPNHIGPAPEPTPIPNAVGEPATQLLAEAETLLQQAESEVKQ